MSEIENKPSPVEIAQGKVIGEVLKAQKDPLASDAFSDVIVFVTATQQLLDPKSNKEYALAHNELIQQIIQNKRGDIKGYEETYDRFTRRFDELYSVYRAVGINDAFGMAVSFFQSQKPNLPQRLD